MNRVDYDRIAPEYNERFVKGDMEDTARALKSLARNLKAHRILEAGCGTGHWLAGLAGVTPHLYGLDFSAGMLAQARRQPGALRLVRASADRMPWAEHTFDLIYSVDAIHHFGNPGGFIQRAFSLLEVNGALAVNGMNVHCGKGAWYVYQYFEGTYETDINRFPSKRALIAWMGQAGFECITVQEVRKVDICWNGRQVLDDPFLKKNSCSQLALLSDEAYQAGMEKIQAALRQAEAKGETLQFRHGLSIEMVVGYKLQDRKPDLYSSETG